MIEFHIVEACFCMAVIVLALVPNWAIRGKGGDMR